MRHLTDDQAVNRPLRPRAALLGGVSALTLACLLPAGAAQAQVRTISTSVPGPVDASDRAITLTGSGAISGSAFGSGIYNAGGAIGTLTNGGSISGYTGVNNLGTLATLTNTGAISGVDTGVGSYGGSIGTLSNSGTISGGYTGIANNGGGITRLSNAGTISGGHNSGISNSGSIGALTNSGSISGGGDGIDNPGTISSLINRGSISGGNLGIYNTGLIGTLTNSGTVSSVGSAGIYNAGTITTLVNSGTAAIFNVSGGTIGALGNSYNGTITGLYSGTKIGTITNSGVITGQIVIAHQNVVMTGGSGSTIGTLTGGSLTGGSLTVTNGNLLFAGGRTLMDDIIVVNGVRGTVSNAGVLEVTESQNIGGSFIQTAAGVLDFQAGGTAAFGSLNISGAATLGGGLAFDLASGFTLAAGDDFGVLTFASRTRDFSGFSFDGVACTAGGADAWTCGSSTFAEVFTGTSLSLDVTSSTVPEPAMMGLFASGLAALGLLRRRRA